AAARMAKILVHCWCPPSVCAVQADVRSLRFRYAHVGMTWLRGTFREFPGGPGEEVEGVGGLYSLRSQRFHRLCLPCEYRWPEDSHQQGRQQDQQGCKVKPQIIWLHPVQLTA